MPDVTELGLDTSDAVQNVLALSRVLEGYVSALGSVAGVASKFNADGSSQSHTIRQVTKDFDKLTATLSHVDDAYAITSVSVQKYLNTFAASNKLRSDIFDANRMKESAAAVEIVIEGLTRSLQGRDVTKAYVQELAKFDRAIKNTATTAIQAGVSVQQVETLFAKFQTGATSIHFSGIEKEIVRGFERASQAAAQFGTNADQASNRLASAEAQRIKNVQKVQSELFAAREKGAQQAAEVEAASVRQLTGEYARLTLAKGFGFDIQKGSIAEIDRFRGATNAAVNEFVRGTLSLQEFDAIFQKVINGSREFSTSEIALARTIQAAADAQARFGTDAQKAREAALAATKRETEAQAALRAELDRSHAKYLASKATEAAAGRYQGAGAAVGSALTGAFGGNLFAASEREAQRFNLAVNKIASDIARLKFSPGQLEDVFTRAAAGATRFVGVENDIYQKYLALTNAVSAFGSESKSAADTAATATRRAQEAAIALAQALDKSRQKAVDAARAQSDSAGNLADANALKAALAAAYAPSAGLTASLNETRALDGAINRLTADVAAGKVPADAYYSALVKLASGVTTFDVEEGKLVLKLQAVQAAQEAVGTAAETASNRSIAAAKREQAERDRAAASLARQKATALKEDNKTTGAAYLREQVQLAQQLANEFFKINEARLSPAQLAGFTAALRQALDLVAKGTVNLDHFRQGLNNLKSGYIDTTLPQNLTKLQSKLIQTQAALDKVGEAGEKSALRIHLSWQNVIRIFESQVLFSLFSKLQSAFASSIPDAAEYSRSIALIQTISQDANIASGEWADSIRRVSDALGSPLIETSAAAYDLLSNQVTRGAETITTLRSAIEFGRTTNTNATDSVNLLSSAINTFRLGAGDAETVAAKFFTVIDLGRVKGSEISNNFARAGSLAEALGTSLNETGAALSSLTRQGIKANEAFTLMNNVAIKLIKPTESLQARIKSWGFETGQQAVEALGFVGVLERLSAAYQGNTAAAAKDFDELRGARGIIALTGKGLQEFKKDLAEISNAGDKYKIAKGIINESDGQKLQVEFNKIKTFFTNEVGGTLLSSVLNFSARLGGLAEAVKVVVGVTRLLAIALGTAFVIVKVQALFVAIVQATQAFRVMIGVITAAKVAAGEFGAASVAAMHPAVLGTALVVGALAAIVLSLNEIGAASPEAFKSLANAEQDAADAMIASTKEWADRHQAVTDDLLSRTGQAFQQYFAEIRIGMDQAADALKEKSDAIAESIANRFGTLIGIYKDRVAEMETASKHATDEVKKAQDAIEAAENDRTQNHFNWAIQAAKDAKDYVKVLALVQARVRQLNDESNEAYANGDRTRGAALNKEAQQIIAATERLKKQEVVRGTRPVYHRGGTVDAPGQGDIDPSKRKKLKTGYYTNVPTTSTRQVPAIPGGGGLNKAQDQLVQNQIANEKAYAARQADIAENAKQEATAEKNNLKILEDKVKAAEKFSVFNKKGEVKPEYEGEKGRAQASEDRAKLEKDALDAIDKQGKSLVAGSTKAIAAAEQRLLLEKEIGESRKAFDDTLASIARLEGLATAAKNVGENVSSMRENIAGAAADVNKLTEAYGRHNAAILTDVKQIGAVVKEYSGYSSTKTARDAAAAVAPLLDQIIAEASKKGTEAGDRTIKALLGQVDTVLRKGGLWLSGTSLADVIGLKASKPGEVDKTIADLINQVHAGITNRVPIELKLKLSEETLAQAKKELTDFQAEVSSAYPGLKGLAPAAKEASDGILRSFSPTEVKLLHIRGEIDDIRRALEEVGKLEAGVKAGAAAAAPPPAGRSRGGPIGFFAGGGFMDDFFSGKYASGTDRIPIMASRGEYMVNADATRQFLPLLRAINAGKLTPGRAGGGNTSVGDINVTVQGGSSSEATVKNIANGLRRGLRTGTIRLGTNNNTINS